MAKRKGLCRRHADVNICIISGCSTNARRGVCVKHGARTKYSHAEYGKVLLVSKVKKSNCWVKVKVESSGEMKHVRRSNLTEVLQKLKDEGFVTII